MSSREARRPIPPQADEPPAKSPSANQPNSVMLGPRDRLIGQLYIEGDLRVVGMLEGEVEATGDVEIDEVATVKASVAGRDVSVRGRLTGPVTARKRLLVGRSGSLIGDVRVARLVIQDGATFSGKVSMGGPAPSAPTPRAPEATIEAPEPALPAAQSPVVAEANAQPDGKLTSSDGKGKGGKPMPGKGKPKHR